MRYEHLVLPIDSKYLPKRVRFGDACFDVKARLEMPTLIGQGQVVKIPLGFRIIVRPGFEAQIRSRSGLASKGIFVANSPGCVDENYRNEVCALIYNSTRKNFLVNDGDRIAQMSFAEVDSTELVEIDLSRFDGIVATEYNERGEDGFGSSGI